MPILGPNIVTIPVNMGRDGLPGVINAGSVGIEVCLQRNKDTLTQSVLLKVKPTQFIQRSLASRKMFWKTECRKNIREMLYMLSKVIRNKTNNGRDIEQESYESVLSV